MVATAIVAVAAWIVHFTADGTEPFLRLAGIFVVPVLLLAAVGTITRWPLARRYGGNLAKICFSNNGADIAEHQHANRWVQLILDFTSVEVATIDNHAIMPIVRPAHPAK
jgi:hypothetical protein